MSAALTQPTWESMCRAPEKYRPFIAQMVGLFLVYPDYSGPMTDKFDELHFPNCDLTDDEVDFIFGAALNIIHQQDIESSVWAKALTWIEEGAAI